MCTELKKTINNKYKEVRANDQDQIQKIANDVIKYMKIDNVEELGVPIVDILRRIGFNVYKDEFEQESLSAFIAIDPELQDKFGTNKIICVNSNDSFGHERLALAHELAHYLFDFKEMTTVKYYNTYIADDEFNSKEEIEQRANTFAACLLMPERFFKDLEKN